MNPLVNRIVERLLLPPGLLLLLLLGSLWLWRRQQRRPNLPPPRIITLLLLLGLVFSFGLSLPITSKWLVRQLENQEENRPLRREELLRTKAQAIVILSSGRYAGAPDYDDRDTLATGGLARARYGARVHRITGLPILVSGGRVFPRDDGPEAALMKRVLEEEFQVPVRWSEEESRNTLENARFSARILRAEGITRILLVTHAMHIPRSLLAFRGTGMDVIPAPTLFQTDADNAGILDWIPNAGALATSHSAGHELLGNLWYRWLQQLTGEIATNSTQ
ncbi:MAG: YdcF family protein [Magnetococcales bacterium]|nr:YdcF family protein [Magnetococcales bacterium]